MEILVWNCCHNFRWKCFRLSIYIIFLHRKQENCISWAMEHFMRYVWWSKCYYYWKPSIPFTYCISHFHYRLKTILQLFTCISMVSILCSFTGHDVRSHLSNIFHSNQIERTIYINVFIFKFQLNFNSFYLDSISVFICVTRTDTKFILFLTISVGEVKICLVFCLGDKSYRIVQHIMSLESIVLNCIRFTTKPTWNCCEFNE